MSWDIDDEQFVALIQRAMGELSPDHMAELKHVQILSADEPTPHQIEKLKLRGDHLLLGLYEGVPRTQRSGNESGLMNDRITIFKQPLMQISESDEEFYENIKRTVWHEIAHYFGISHAQMDELQHRH